MWGIIVLIRGVVPEGVSGFAYDAYLGGDVDDGGVGEE
jgi:hypothetical protein